MSQYKIFISHAVSDREISEKIINLLVNGARIDKSEIFCSSIGSPIAEGEPFSVEIRNALNESELVLLLLSKNFAESKFCLAELGGTWLTEKNNLPIIIPPESFDSLSTGPLVGHHGMIISDDNFVGNLHKRLIERKLLKSNDQKQWNSAALDFSTSIQDICDQVEAERLSFKYDIFISSPMSFESDDEFIEQKQIVLDVIQEIAINYPLCKCYFAGKDFDSKDDFMNARVSVEDDWEALNKSRAFLMLLPQKMNTSCVVEAGYAIAKNKPVMLMVKKSTDLPYMLQKIDTVNGTSESTRLIEYGTTSLIKEIQKNIKWIMK